METKALLVLDTWATSTDFKTDLINTMKSNGLNIITDLEATDIVLAVNYMTSLIYSYYKNYYLSNASKERTLELMSITASGKLNFYASELKAYKDAYAHDFKSLGGNENSSTHDTTLNRSGKSKQAITPETIAKGTDYIDDYASSEQKYENANKETGARSYNSTIKGSEQDYWKNIISIPKRLFEDIIGSFSKFFFSSSMELTPCAVLTIEQAIQKLKDEIKALDTTTSTEINSLKSLIKINQEEIKDLKTSVDTLVTDGENTDNRVTTLESQIGDLRRKTDKTNTNLENLTKVTPTDIGVKDNKLGLKHDTTWLTNQDAITLGDNLTYDDTTKTLNVKGDTGGSSNVIVIKGNENDSEDLVSYTITLTEEQFNKIYDTDYPVILSLDPNNGLLSEIVVQKALNNNVKEISIGLSITKFDADLGFISILANTATFTLNNLVQTLQVQSSTILGVHYNPLEKNFGMGYISLTQGLQLVGYLNPDISELDKSKYFIPQVFNGSITWIEKPIAKQYYFDKINGTPINHETEIEVKNYIIGDYTTFQEDDHTDYVKILLKKNNVEEYYGGYVPKALNPTATPKVLRSVNNSMSWVELPKYYEHDGMLKVNTNYIMFKYISNDSVAQTDFNQLINDFSGNYITASGSFELGTDQIAMVYGIDFDTLMLSCNVLDMNTHKLGNDDIAFSDLTIGTYSENVRLIN